MGHYYRREVIFFFILAPLLTGLSDIKTTPDPEFNLDLGWVCGTDTSTMFPAHCLVLYAQMEKADHENTK